MYQHSYIDFKWRIESNDILTNRFGGQNFDTILIF
eukprot:SAG11_NODE_21212_length_429_cov_1.790909_1_plen_34_part_10